MRILSVNKWRRSGDLQTLGAPRGVMLGHKALVQRGHQIDYIFIDDVCKGAKLRFPHLMFSMLITPKIVQLTSQRNYDVVEISSGDGWIYGLFRRIVGRRGQPLFVATAAGLEHLVWEEALKDHDLGLQEIRGFRARVLRPFMILKQVEIAIRTSHHYVPLRGSDAEYAIQRRWKDLSEVTVIPRGVDAEYFVERKIAERIEKLLFVGTWHPRKGIKYLVDAFCILKKEHPSLQISLIGTRLREQVIQDFPPEVHDSVRVVPLMSPEAVIEEYATHHVFILPSNREGCPKVLLEAMAASMPIVASQGAGSDLITHETDGLLVPNRDGKALANAVECLIMDQALCRRLGEKARSEARKYNWDKIAAQYESLYMRLLRERK